MTVMDKTKKIKHRRGREKIPKKSIFYFNEEVHCLAAVNYFRHQQFTQVIYVATSLEEPPKQSKLTTWRRNGLATYLICMLLKQHTYADNHEAASVPTLLNSNFCSTHAHHLYDLSSFPSPHGHASYTTCPSYGDSPCHPEVPSIYYPKHHVHSYCGAPSSGS
jgi:hypothetical protein